MPSIDAQVPIDCLTRSPLEVLAFIAVGCRITAVMTVQCIDRLSVCPLKRMILRNRWHIVSYALLVRCDLRDSKLQTQVQNICSGMI
ncbi:MAG: hypothetical protein JWP89_6968 [Schlesneria sp.]|nr:hypothetical protein [Schlesneria sp.]